jgi:hypothetical protein
LREWRALPPGIYVAKVLKNLTNFGTNPKRRESIGICAEVIIRQVYKLKLFIFRSKPDIIRSGIGFPGFL